MLKQDIEVEGRIAQKAVDLLCGVFGVFADCHGQSGADGMDSQGGAAQDGESGVGNGSDAIGIKQRVKQLVNEFMNPSWADASSRWHAM